MTFSWTWHVTIVGKCGERFAYALAKLGAGNLGSCLWFVALMLGKLFPLTVPSDLMPHLSAFHVMTIAKGISQFWSFLFPGEKGLGVFIYCHVNFLSFLLLCCLGFGNTQYISGQFHGRFFLIFVYYLITASILVSYPKWKVSQQSLLTLNNY